MENGGSMTSSIDPASSEQGTVNKTVTFQHNVFNYSTMNINQGGSHSQNTTPRAKEKFKYCLSQSEVIGRNREANELLKLVKIHRRVVISGMGGIGKTSLAAHCAKIWSPTFISNAIFIDAETDEAIKRAFSCLRKLSEINVQEFEDPRIQAEEIYKVFGKNNTLIIFDNVTSYLNITQYLPPEEVNFYIIITSQISEFDKTKYFIYDLPNMTQENSRKLMEDKFRKFMKKDLPKNLKFIEDEKEEIETIIEKMQGHPLAIIQAVAYIADLLTYEVPVKFPVKTYLDEFNKNFNNIVFEKYWGEVHRCRSVYMALLMNMKTVKKNIHVGAKAEIVLHCMAFLNPTFMLTDMFSYLCDSNDKLLNAVIRRLRKYSLIETGGRAYYITIHRLVQHTSQCMLKEKVETLKLVLRNTLKLLINSDKFHHHAHFILPHMEDKLSDLNECYSEVYSSGPRREQLTEALREVNCESVVEGWTAAHYAAFEQNKCMLELLKERGQSFSVVSQQHWTVLHAYCIHRYNNLYLDDIIGLEKSNLNKQTSDQNTALHILLMKEVCRRDFLKTFHYCCSCYDALKLIDSGCDVTLTNKDGNTAAHLAAKYGHFQVLALLLESAGVDIKQKNNASHSVSTLAEELHLVIYRHTSQPPAEERMWYSCIHLEPLETLEAGVKLLKHLVEGGGDVPDGVYQDIVQLLHNMPIALKLAAGYMRLRNIHPTEFTQRLTAPPEDTVPSPVRDSWFGYCPTNIYVLFCDVLNYLETEHKSAFELLSYIPYVDDLSRAVELYTDRYSEEVRKNREILDTLSLWDPHRLFICVTATYSQIRGKERAVCASLITTHVTNRRVIDHAVRVLGVSGVQAAYREEYGGAPAAVQEKIDRYTRGVRELDVGDLDRWSALHWAVYLFHYSVMEELLRIGVPVDLPADDGIAPLHLAALYGHSFIIKLLCTHGATVNASTARQGLTPLHLAAIARHYDSTKYLISQGANKNVKDSAGRTPDDIYSMPLPTDSSKKWRRF